ncbi:MAG: hypothetical protein JXR68_04670 [Bacteroidales bacterium]|nr:hypothetical protein [Bacteroidales bacterium]
MATKINIQNYELFAIDYIDGNLSDDVKAEFELFLNKNPEIKSEISDLSNFSLNVDDEVAFVNKNSLKKSPVEGLTYNEFLIVSDIEKQISDSEKQDLEFEFKNNKNTALEYNKFKQTQIKKEKIVFDKKWNIKKTPVDGLSYAEYLMISDLEKTISEQETKELNSVLRNKQKNTEFALYKKVVLPKEKIIYPNKQSLKRTNIVSFKRIRNVAVLIAAMFVVFFGVKMLFLNNQFITTTSATIALDNVSITDYNFKRSIEVIPDFNQNDEIINQPQQNYDNQNQQQVYVDDNQFDVTPDLYVDTNYQQIAFENNLPAKQYQLTDINVNSKVDFLTKVNDYQFDDNTQMNFQTDDVVNFVFDKLKNFTESDRTLRVDFDRDNKCYGIEYNEKIYSVCLK